MAWPKGMAARDRGRASYASMVLGHEVAGYAGAVPKLLGHHSSSSGIGGTSPSADTGPPDAFTDQPMVREASAATVVTVDESCGPDTRRGGVEDPATDGMQLSTAEPTVALHRYLNAHLPSAKTHTPLWQL